MKTHQIKVDIKPNASTFLDRVRSRYHWKLPQTIGIALELLNLHLWAHEHGKKITVDGEEITITEIETRESR